MARPLRIGLTGPAGCGKNAVGEILGHTYRYAQTSFANALRSEVDDALRGYHPLQLPSEIKLLLAHCKDQNPWAKPTSPEMRRLLQWWGTEFRRAADPGYWLSRISLEVDMDSIHIPHSSIAPPPFGVAVTDVRFPNEAALIRLLGGVIWEITGRRDQAVPAHVSEHGIGSPADLVIDNSGTLEDLEVKVKEAMESYDQL